MGRIYKILGRAEWEAAKAKGTFEGSAVDLHDGYIHFSTGPQAPETALRYFSGQADLVVLEVEADSLGPALKWEPSRGGDLFPHLYSSLTLSEVLAVRPVAVDPAGVPVLGNLR